MWRQTSSASESGPGARKFSRTGRLIKSPACSCSTGTTFIGGFDQAMEHMETMAALSLSVVLRECKQMGTALTTEQGVRFLESHILPHQNRGILKNRADEIAMQFQSVLAKNNRQGIRTQAEKKEVASAWLELAISCAKVPVKYEADEIKRRQKEEKTQREAEPVMA